MRALASAVAAMLVLGVSPAGAAGRPVVRILGVAPIRIEGARFLPGERVTLLVNAGRPFTRTVTAGPRGGFSVRLKASVGRCTAVVVQAIGRRGSRAMADIIRPGCGERPG